jgi:hypothetical protein
LTEILSRSALWLTRIKFLFAHVGGGFTRFRTCATSKFRRFPTGLDGRLTSGFATRFARRFATGTTYEFGRLAYIGFATSSCSAWFFLEGFHHAIRTGLRRCFWLILQLAFTSIRLPFTWLGLAWLWVWRIVPLDWAARFFFGACCFRRTGLLVAQGFGELDRS